MTQSPIPAAVLVPRWMLEEASRALGSFVSDEGWTSADMQAMDNLDAILARDSARAVDAGSSPCDSPSCPCCPNVEMPCCKVAPAAADAAPQVMPATIAGFKVVPDPTMASGTMKFAQQTVETQAADEVTRLLSMAERFILNGHSADATHAVRRLAALARPAADAGEAQHEVDRLTDVLAQIGDYAHDKSTGPAVPDALWTVRAMAYDALSPTIAALASLPVQEGRNG